MELDERISELERKFEEFFVRGIIVESNSVERWVIVSYGADENPMTTGRLPVKPFRSGKAIVWWFPEVGEAVTVISPGDLRFGEVFPGSYYSERPAPSDDPDLFLVEFGDGSKISHHRGTHKLELINMGDVEATIEGNVTGLIKGDVTATVEGNLTGTVKGTTNATFEQNVIALVKGDVKATVEGSLTGTVKGTTNATFDQDVTAHVKGNATVNCDKAVSVSAKGAIDVQTNQTLTVKSAGAMSLATDADMQVKAGGNMKFTAARIDFN
ncbi:phage baseplate assembly protein V [Vibrio parahaemolyticus]|uniref:phage baseplate assembly protein V n=1 Tax=Vibrio parahaemolyticus TaxID=670 RepID=UPI001D16CB13|nr:phage baseplate assembly protein V [Vibrio parahaemolyticus]MCC3798260.1 phage baseplate assembly protein V [Vibrio parahaemolyticus]